MSQSRRPSILTRVGQASAAGLCFALFWVIAAMLAWIVFPCMNWLYRRQSWAQRTHRFQRIASGGFLILVHFMRWLRLHDFHPGHVRWQTPDEPFVLIGNHPTLIDVVVLWALQRKLCCIAKPALFRNPVLGPLLRYCGFIEAGEGMAGGAVIRAAMDRLEAGFPVLLFPEGTRSPVGGLGRFSRGAFEIAVRAQKPVLPVWISCSPPTLCRGMAWYSLPKTTISLRFVPLAPSHMDRWNGNTHTAAIYYHDLFAAKVHGELAGDKLVAPCPGVAHEPRSA